MASRLDGWARARAVGDDLDHSAEGVAVVVRRGVGRLGAGVEGGDEGVELGGRVAALGEPGSVGGAFGGGVGGLGGGDEAAEVVGDVAGDPEGNTV